MPSIINALTASGGGVAITGDATGNLALQTAGNTAVTVNTSKGVQFHNCIGVGNATPSTSGAGITFPATQSASSDANTLDDYEEGTFTPTNSVVALTSNSGIYTKIGRVVQWSCTFIVPSTANTTAIKIDGLPFTTANDQGARSGASVGFTNSGTIMSVMVDTNSTSFYFYSYAGANIVLNNLSNSYVYCGGTYTV